LWNPSDLKDFRGFLLRVRETKADCIVFFPTPPDPDIFFRQMKELGIETPVIGTETYAMVEDKKWVEGKWLSGCPPMATDMIAKLKTYGIDPKLTYDPYAYDLPGMMIQAVETAGKTNAGRKPTGAQIRDALAGMKTINTSFGDVQQDSNGTFHPRPTLIYYESGVGREVSLDELRKLKGVK
jgi:ABC-type branched-subunit amino acid transport system substrate-binding protein